MTEMPIKMTKKKKTKNQTSFSNYKGLGNSLAVQWLGLHTSTVGGMGWIPGLGTKMAPPPQKIYIHTIYTCTQNKYIYIYIQYIEGKTINNEPCFKTNAPGLARLQGDGIFPCCRWYSLAKTVLGEDTKSLKMSAWSLHS